MKNKMKIMGAIFVLAVLFISACSIDNGPVTNNDKLSRFSSGQELVDAFKDAQVNNYGGGIFRGDGVLMAAQAETATANGKASDSGDYSETNVQVQGVDEADIIKTDGNYIYAIENNKLMIAKAYPEEDAEILYEEELDNFYPNELFIEGSKLLVFGVENYNTLTKEIDGPMGPKQVADDVAIDSGLIMPYYGSFMSVKLYDISDKQNPELIKDVDFEGNYLTSRKIDNYVYFVVNSYPRVYAENYGCLDIVPLYREAFYEEVTSDEFKPIANCVDIGYIMPIQARSFITIAGIDMDNGDVNKETIVGSGEDVYASEDNIYIAQTAWPMYDRIGGLAEEYKAKTVITKFSLESGDINYETTGEVNGDILNQFSMDEDNGYFRIATTISGYEDNKDTSTNNLYVLDNNLELVGSLEDVAVGESIYSVRFMQDRAYMVTFRHVDPLFVIDLSDPSNPEILGKLKIPGYSDYLHPYDETHLIGIGKEVDASIDADKVHTEGAVYYTAIQGVKISLFDVSDVNNPVEMDKVIIGDRGTESLATSEHKAFLFDKEKGLLIIPMTVAELKEGQDKSEQGEFTFQGTYVYEVSLDGFNLRGRVTHYDDDEAFKKSGYYFYGNAAITRSLYIGNILYTLSNERLQLNDLSSLDRLKVLEFTQDEQGYPVVYAIDGPAMA